ncbi:MFS transporter [Pseudonocardia sp. H11422]|uniref:MFS transporter n=1 Tax=Pseudonocardia sp. H11422 TaxID=2835866 RepID=UPI0027E270E5|nr:MFS transporter [Pseudonocardia sp. H11422]
MFAALLAPAGRLADRYGRRRLFLVGVAIFTLASAACAVAVAVPMLVAFRAVGAALIMPASLVLLLTAFPAGRRTVAVGIWSAVGGAASVGPPLGGLLVEASWRWIFLVNVPVGVATLIAGRRVLRESAEPGSGRPDVLGAIGLVVGVGAPAWARVVTRRSRRHPAPALDLAALRSRSSRSPAWRSSCSWWGSRRSWSRSTGPSWTRPCSGTAGCS